MRLMAPVLFAMLLPLAGASAQIDAQEAEKRILAACAAETGGAAPERCDCYVSEIKSRVPAGTYGSMIVLAAAALSGDMELLRAFVEKAQLDPEAYDRMLGEMERAVSLAAAICGA